MDLKKLTEEALKYKLDESRIEKTDVLEFEKKTTKELDVHYLMEGGLIAQKNSYSPYSQFKVGTCFYLDNGHYLCGSNVENMSFGATVCGERSAIFKLMSNYGCKIIEDKKTGEKKTVPNVNVKAVCVATPKGVSSCGMCLQVFQEFLDKEVPILLLKSGWWYDNTFNKKESRISEVVLDDSKTVQNFGQIFPGAIDLKELQM